MRRRSKTDLRAGSAPQPRRSTLRFELLLALFAVVLIFGMLRK